jgi:hypothetical protein
MTRWAMSALGHKRSLVASETLLLRRVRDRERPSGPCRGVNPRERAILAGSVGPLGVCRGVPPADSPFGCPSQRSLTGGPDSSAAQPSREDLFRWQRSAIDSRAAPWVPRKVSSTSVSTAQLAPHYSSPDNVGDATYRGCLGRHKGAPAMSTFLRQLLKELGAAAVMISAVAFSV